MALPSGRALSPAEVDDFLRWRAAKFITIIGERDSGKTTLICAIYDRFLRGPFAGYLFAGSRTLITLEERSHPSRVESGRAKPDTPHTSLSEGLKFFHIAVASAENQTDRTDLMLSDRAGEFYRRARGDSSIVSELIEVAKADRVVLLLDGGRVASAAERAGAMQAVRQTLRALIDGDSFDRSAIVQVVTTKVDLITAHGDKEIIDAQLAAFRRQLCEDFASGVAELSFSDIAARDPEGVFPPAHGVDTLFRSWVTPRAATVERPQVRINARTEFDKLLLRTPMELHP